MAIGRMRRPRPLAALQLTSLLDMFTIILVFLLQSFQADDEDFTMNADVSLPASSARSPFKGAVNIAVTKEAVLVEGVPLLKLEQGVAPKEDLERGKVDGVTEAVRAAWEAKPREVEEMVATIQADQALPYDTIDLVMRSAGHAGCFRFRLVVEKQ